MFSWIPRAFVAFASVCLMVLFVHARAEAMVEYCPAMVTMSPAGAPGAAPGAAPRASTYALWLSASTPRNVSGRAAIHTDAGWYVVNVPETALTQVTQQWKDRYVQFSRRVAQSAPLFVSFPKPVSVASAFMLNAKTQGETQLGWDAKGTVQCSPQIDRLERPRSNRQLAPTGMQPHLISPLFVAPQPPASAQVLPAMLSSGPGDTSCPVPFRDAKAFNLPRVPYPEAAKYRSVKYGDAFVEVAISATGSVDDAWIFAPTGSPPLDQAAVRAAKMTSYKPAIAFCQKVPSIYSFLSEFKP